MTVRFGIIGLGGIANRFAGVLNTAEGTKLVAVAARNMTRARQFGEKHNAERYYDSYDALLQDDAVDIVYIALTHNFHYEAIKNCILHGKAVICEKPLVITQKDADELIALAKEKNVLLMEAMWTRCIPAFQKAREWVAAGLIGKPQLVQAAFCFHFPYDETHRLFNPELAGGSLFDAGVYPLEFATGILGENPVHVNGIAHKCATGVDDFAVINLGFESGALASISCGLNANVSQDAVVYGTEGKVVVYGFLGPKKVERYNEKGELLESFEEDFKDGFLYEILHVSQLIREGKLESNNIPLKDTSACAGIFDTLMAQWKEINV